MSGPIKVPTGEELKTLIAFEKEQIENAPAIPIIRGPLERCHFCGQPAASDVMEQVSGPHEQGQVQLKCPRCQPNG